MNNKLKDLLHNKVPLNKDVTDIAFKTFTRIKKILKEYASELSSESTDPRIKIAFTDPGSFEAELKICDDVIIFIMHTNAMIFDRSHHLWKTGYLHADEIRGTCAMIAVYNFLSDSFKYKRKNDSGQLIARMFINREEHIYAEGKKQLGVLFNDFSTLTTDDNVLTSFIEQCIIYSLELDVNVPGFEAMQEISVHDVMNYNMQSALTAGNRLGFKFRDAITDSGNGKSE